MAKSLRSKWKRKCRAVKRIRYGKKELERLKSILGCESSSTKSEKIEGASISDIAEVKTIQEIKEHQDLNVNEVMDIDTTLKSSLKTLKDKNGAYPIWLHPRKIPKKGKKQKKNKVMKKKGKGRK